MANYEKLYYNISEVAAYFNEEVSAIRYWEKRFSILKPKKNKRGVRFFTAHDMENLELIHYLIRTKKMTVEGAQQELILRAEEVDRKVAALRKLKNVRMHLETLKNKL